MDNREQAPLGRRTFLKGALAATALAAVPAGILSGCSQQSADSAASAASSGPMTPEERAKATADSIYMGGDTNYYGQPLEMTEGPAGQITSKAPLDWLGYQVEAGAFEKVTDRIYASHTYPLCNSVMFVGDTGIVVLETSGNCEAAEKDLEMFRTITDKPVAAIIYSHEHYAQGTTVYIPADNPENIPIIAHEDILAQMAYTMGPISPAYGKRGALQYSTGIPGEGPDAAVVGAAGSKKAKETFGFIAPNTFISGKEPMTEMKLAGLTFRLYPGSSDSPASLSVYCVEENTLFSNHVMPTFFNMYTLRGEAYRNPDPFIKELDILRALNAENLIPSMGRCIAGKEAVDREFTLYRDGVQYVYDQTIRYMNQGYGPDELTRKVKIPSFLVEGILTQPVYGELEHHVRGVYRGIIGWFGTDVVELHPVSKEFESGKIVEAMGGADAVVAESLRVLEDDQYSWAATLASYVLDVEPEHEGARDAKAKALLEMAHITSSSITRSWYTVAAYDLMGELESGSVSFLGGVTEDKLSVAPPSILLDHMRVSIDPDKALGLHESLTLTLTDDNTSTTMILRNCVGAIEAGKPASPSVELRMSLATMGSILMQKTSLDDAISAGKVEMVGDESKLALIRDICELKI